MIVEIFDICRESDKRRLEVNGADSRTCGAQTCDVQTSFCDAIYTAPRLNSLCIHVQKLCTLPLTAQGTVPNYCTCEIQSR